MKLHELIEWATSKHAPDDAEIVIRTHDDEIVQPVKDLGLELTPDPFSESVLIVVTPDVKNRGELVPKWGQS